MCRKLGVTARNAYVKFRYWAPQDGAWVSYVNLADSITGGLDESLDLVFESDMRRHVMYHSIKHECNARKKNYCWWGITG